MKNFIHILAVDAIATGGWVSQAYADTVPAPDQQAVPQTHILKDYEHESPHFMDWTSLSLKFSFHTS